MNTRLRFLDIIKLIFKFVAFHIMQYFLSTKERIVIDTTHGKVKGIKRKTIYDQTYFAFEGIPYAKPPLGELRFRAPQPAERWEGVRDCTYSRSKPLQIGTVIPIAEGSEDCLYLNIFVKKLESEKPLPVMVSLPFGGFQRSEPSRAIFSPDYFMEKEVILIVIAYRVGAMGFLSFADPELKAPGNAGLKDQLMALKWIKENCANFNGDANNITLFGLSSGAASAHYMMLTEKTKGLFHKVILNSGCALTPWASTSNQNWGYELAKYIGYKGKKDDKSVFGYLSKIKAKRLITKDGVLFSQDEIYNRVLFNFLPIVEPYVGEDCIIPRPPIEMMRCAWSNEIPLILSGSSFEGSVLYTLTKRTPLLSNVKNCECLVPPDLILHRSREEISRIGNLIKKVYYGDNEPNSDRIFTYLDIMSYYYFWHPFHRTLLSREKYATGSTYLYRFDFDSVDFNHARYYNDRRLRGTGHGDDFSYIFFSFCAWKLPEDSPELKTIKRLIGIFTNFAAKSDPNCEEISPLYWSPLKKNYNSNVFKCLNVSDNLEIIDLPEGEKLKLWDSFYRQEEIF